MKLRELLVFFGSVLTVVFGQRHCGDQRKCVPLSDCPEYQSYVGTSFRTWPLAVRNEIKSKFCGTEQGVTGTIYKLCCNTEDPMRPGEKSGRDLLDLNTCGRRPTDRIAHGNIAEVFEYPWMALLGDINGDFHCEGSLIAESFVLTAAHSNSKKVDFVRVGETDLSTPIDCNKVQGEEDCAEPYQDIQVDRFIRHHGYSVSKKKNDIALVKLAKPAQLNDNVRPICLPLPESVPRQLPLKMTISGWGQTEDRNTTSNALRYALIPIVESNQCQQAIRQLSAFYTVDESVVCTGNVADREDTFAGGPLQYFGKKGYVIHGVTSWTMAPSGEEGPMVFSKVYHYLDWIIDNLK